MYCGWKLIMEQKSCISVVLTIIWLLSIMWSYLVLKNPLCGSILRFTWMIMHPLNIIGNLWAYCSWRFYKSLCAHHAQQEITTSIILEVKKWQINLRRWRRHGQEKIKTKLFHEYLNICLLFLKYLTTFEIQNNEIL